MNNEKPKLPVGRIRNPFAPIGLSLVTFGIYWLVWMYKILEEMRQHADNPKITSGGSAVGFLFIPLFHIFWLIYLWFRLPICVNHMKETCGTEAHKLNASIGLLCFIPLIGFIIWSALIQSSLNDHWRSHGSRI